MILTIALGIILAVVLLAFWRVLAGLAVAGVLVGVAVLLLASMGGPVVALIALIIVCVVLAKLIPAGW